MERRQYDIALDSQRFGSLIAQDASEQIFAEQKAYIEQQLKTDIGERLDRAESHYVYEIRGDKLYGEGIEDPFEDVIERGIIQNWEGSREESELTAYKFVQSYMTDPETADGTIVFNPSLPDGKNYQKNYLDVYKKVGNEVHTVRYFSDLSGEEYREKILEINPAYVQVIPEDPKDTDFFLNPVVIPKHLNLNPDQLAEFVLGGKKGMREEEIERIWIETAPVWTSIINTLTQTPDDLDSLKMMRRALLNASYKSSLRLLMEKSANKIESVAEIEKRSGFNWKGTIFEIKMLASEPKRIGGGGCGSDACSATSESTNVPVSAFDNLDGRGSLSFRCPECNEVNTRELFKYVSNCQKCGTDKVLPPSVKYLQA